MREAAVLGLLLLTIRIGYANVGSNEDIRRARIANIVVEANPGSRENLTDAGFIVATRRRSLQLANGSWSVA